MASHTHEFQCDGRGTATPDRPTSENCGWYNYPHLNDKMTGNYTIVCGNCGHKHYRYIKNGVVTADRHNETYGAGEVIHVLKSQTSKEKRKFGAMAQIRQMEAAGLMTVRGE